MNKKGGIISGVITLILLIILVVAFIFTIFLARKDIIFIKDLVEETERNNGTCKFDWKSFHLNCEYKNNTCIINGTTEFSCKKYVE